MNTLTEFEAHTGLTPTQAALFLAIPRPTYYQYRRSGVMPPVVERCVTIASGLSASQLNQLIRKYVYVDDGEL